MTQVKMSSSKVNKHLYLCHLLVLSSSKLLAVYEFRMYTAGSLHKSAPLYPILIQSIPVLVFKPISYTLHFNIIILSLPKCSQIPIRFY